MSFTTGAATNSKNPDRYAPGAPQTIARASGAFVWGQDNDRYVDLTSGLGAVLLGHGHPDVTRAMRAQLEFGLAFPIPSYLEETVAEQLCEFLEWGDKVRWSKNGRDATVAAVRLARAITGRETVFYCDYHGSDDLFLRDPPWNAGVVDVKSRKMSRQDVILEGALHDEVACVILEPVSSNDPDAPHDRAFFDKLRQRCDEAGCLMILDEMVSFGRAPGGSGMQFIGIEPDLWVGGKCLANGMPLTAVVGPAEYMERFALDVFHSMTHAGEALSLAAAHATIPFLQYASRAANEVGEMVVDMFDRRGHGGSVKYAYPSRLLFDFGIDELSVLLDRGVLCAGYANFTSAHAMHPANHQIIDAFDAVLS